MEATNHGSGNVSVLSKDNAEKIVISTLNCRLASWSTSFVPNVHPIFIVFCAMGIELELGSVPCLVDLTRFNEILHSNKDEAKERQRSHGSEPPPPLESLSVYSTYPVMCILPAWLFAPSGYSGALGSKKPAFIRCRYGGLEA